jgi:hypothetical protein
MKVRRTAHACLDEGWGRAGAKPSAQQPCAGERGTDLLHAKQGAPRCGTTKRRFGSAKLGDIAITL